MGQAEWDSRFRRTGFYETHSSKNGLDFRVFVPIYLVTIAGSNFPPLIEPADAYLLGGVPIGLGTTGRALDWGKCDDARELGTSLNNILEDRKTGEEKPTQLHACSFGWPA